MSAFRGSNTSMEKMFKKYAKKVDMPSSLWNIRRTHRQQNTNT